MSFWNVSKRVIGEADVVVEVLDARMPDLSRNEELENILLKHDKQIIRVFNKIDLVSKNSLAILREENRDALFVSGSKNIGIKKLKVALLILGKRMKKSVLKVGVVGYPNVGKSSIINVLVKGARARVSPTAGTTTGMQFVKASSLKILDSPGVIPFGDNEVKLGILGAKNPEKLKNVEIVAMEVIKRLLHYNKPALEEYAGSPLEGEEYDILLEIGKRKGSLMKGGVVDERRISIQVIRDWQRGKLRI